MKRKWIRAAAAILAAALVLVTLVSCVGDAGDQPGGDTGDAGNHAGNGGNSGNGGNGGGQNDPHTHTFSADWSSDDACHWHAATCGHADQTEGKAVHTYENGVCTVCGKAETVTPPAPHEHTFSADWSSDSTYHWHAATCEHADQVADKAAHVYGNGACKICGRAESTASEGLVYSQEDDAHSYTVVGIGTCTDSDLVIPAVYNGLPVTGIGEEAFSHCTSLTSVAIPNSVTRIGFKAFYDCTSLTSVLIPDSVTIFGGYAFWMCSSLTAVTIPDGMTEIGYGAFCACNSLTSVLIPDSVTNIGDYAFSTCPSLASITIPNSVTRIGYYAFEGCTSLTSVSIPDSVTQIGSGAFFECTSLTSVSIPDSVTQIGTYAFARCSQLNYTHYDNADYLGNDQNPYVVLIRTTDHEISSHALHPDTRIIYGYAFQYCTSLTSVSIPDQVTQIGCYAFQGCTSLASVSIPNSVTRIGDDAFRGCTSLASVSMGNGVTGIGQEAFCGCTSLTSVTIPGSVTRISILAFAGCTSLTSAIFEKKDGWQRGGSPVDVSDPARNAEMLQKKDLSMWENNSRA